ncbi:MAG: Trk family potassium uptake protein, partial [Candidatus Omnitrophica bacterium]|nr:Trk family potassium uptake protein [Candidatus Omnitrophota bacterium]
MFSFFKLTPPRIVLLSFLGAIFLGTILLSLPVSRQPGQNLSFIDALFTAASAACVTGLVVK